MATVQDLQVVAPRTRLQGRLPKIGIRPTIDGRRKGVRESLEDQTMNNGQGRRSTAKREPAPSERDAGRVRHRRYVHRWR